MHKLVLIGVGGFLGTLARYWLSSKVDERLQTSFPYGTLAVNLLGCLIAGFLFQALEQATVSEELRLGVFFGFLGGFTTFSAYALQTVVLARGDLSTLAALHVIVSNVGCLAMVWLGGGLSRGLLGR